MSSQPATKMTLESPEYNSLIQALQTLAGVCDGAIKRDDSGFNAFDSGFGKSLAEQSMQHPISTGQQLAAIKMLQKYRQQLSQHGITLPTMTAYNTMLEKNNSQPAPQPQPAKPAVQPAQASAPIEQRQPAASVTITMDQKNLIIRFAYNPELVAKVKTLEERKYQPEYAGGKAWTAPFRLIEKVVELFPSADISEDVLALLNKTTALRSKSRSAASAFEVGGLKGELLPFQKAGVEFLTLADGRAVLADEMGLGKTIQAIAYLQHLPEQRPAVIVVPASLKINWQREIAKWMTSRERVYVVNGGKPIDLRNSGITIVIINYDILGKWLDVLKALQPQVLIADEAHYCKNPKAARSKTTKELASQIPHTILMTGTPVTNRPVELFPLLNMVDPKSWPSFWRYAQLYCGAQQNGFGWDFSGASNLEDLHQRIQPYVIRRTKDQVLKELPEKRRSTVVLDFDKKAWKDYQAVIAGTIDAINNDKSHKGEAINHLAAIERAKQAAVYCKLPQAIKWVEDFIETEKLILFCTHTFVVDAMMEYFGLAAVRLTGSENQKERQEAVDRFQNDPDCRLFVGNIKAAGVGITLTAASNVAFLEFAWTPGDHSQAEDRAHRIGQQSSVTAYYLVAKDTIDEEIVTLLESKRQIIDTIHDGKVGELDFSIMGELIDYLKSAGTAIPEEEYNRQIEFEMRNYD